MRGRIRTRGVWDVLSPWNARFTVTGRIEDGEAAPEELVLREKDRRKDRTVRVAAGVLHQVKNGAERPERAAPAGVDLVSALWVTLRCDAEQVLNNGRHTYTMTRTDHTLGEDGSERCLYDIVDDDGERSEGRIEFGMRHGQRVPLKIELVDSVRRGLELVAATAAPMAAEGSEAPAAPQAGRGDAGPRGVRNRTPVPIGANRLTPQAPRPGGSRRRPDSAGVSRRADRSRVFRVPRWTPRSAPRSRHCGTPDPRRGRSRRSCRRNGNRRTRSSRGPNARYAGPGPGTGRVGRGP